MYLVFAMIAGVVGGAFSIIMRMELQEPGLQIFSNPHEYAVFVTAHGLTMIFFVVMPALIGGFGNWMVPLLGRTGHGLSTHEQSFILVVARRLFAPP